MTREEFTNALGREPSATDQPAGTYRYRARRGAPWQAVRIIYDGSRWHCVVNGVAVSGEGQADPERIGFIMYHGPFHSITEAEYLAILADYADAKAGTPLATPAEPVNLRRSNPL